MPNEDNLIYLGLFDNCNEAVKIAQKYYKNSDGCLYCRKESKSS